MVKGANRSFVYGVSVSGENFTDRVNETRRLKKNFENGVNVVLISPRRMGKTSLVKKVQQTVDESIVQCVYLDIYDCRNEYDFYNKFASALMKQTANKIELVLQNVKQYLVRLTPKISFSPDSLSDYSLSLGITPEDYTPEEILQLPENIAKHIGKRIVVCIDEFQQIANWPDQLQVQKRLRGVWQHHELASYCLFGSRQHMMFALFQDKGMPFYQFGEPNYLQPIATEDWIPFIQKKFSDKGLSISAEQVTKLCEVVENQSSYVQQLAWNVMINTEEESVTDDILQQGIDDLIMQCSPLLMEQTSRLSTYQMNFLRAIADGQHTMFTAKEIIAKYDLGSKSNASKVQRFLLEKDFVTVRPEGLFFSDPVMERWFQQNRY